MNKFFELAFVFIFCSTCGYILEVAYRSKNAKQLVNPGFLVGPCLPLYGVGGSVIYLLCSLNFDFINSAGWRVVFLIFICTILMTAIEYVAGLISIKIFHERLWDYSDRKWNIQGIICPQFSSIWGVICFLFYYLIFPWLSGLAEFAGSNTIMIFFIGIYLGVFFVDLGYSIDIMSKIRAYSIKFKELVNYEKLKLETKQTYKKKNGRKLSNFSFNLYTKMKIFLEEHMPNFAKTKEVEKQTKDDTRELKK